MKICVVPQVHGVGGMVSFRRKLEGELKRRDITVVDNIMQTGYDAVLVIGGTRRFLGLRAARQRGIPVVQRLDGINWMHRLAPPGNQELRGCVITCAPSMATLVLRLIRSRLATHVVYQSRFVQDWWCKQYGPAPVADSVIYNGVDLDVYHPAGPETPPADCWRILLVEGSLMGGYEGGLQTAVNLMERLSSQPMLDDRPVVLKIVGRVPDHLHRRYEAVSARLEWTGVVPALEIPSLDRAAHLLFSADINAACPNSAIEALACGLPVTGFATGALPELVPDDAGRLAAYGGDPWRLDPPDVNGLAAAAVKIFCDNPRYRQAARAHAVAQFSLVTMVDRYLAVLSGEGA